MQYVWGALAGLAWGALAAFVNFCINKAAVKKNSNTFWKPLLRKAFLHCFQILLLHTFP